MASEDSHRASSWFPAVHCLHDSYDIGEPRSRQVLLRRHHRHAHSKLLEVLLFRRPQRMFLEERDYDSHEVVTPPNGVPVNALPVVIQPPVLDHPTNSEELLQSIQTPDALRALCHDELVEDLVAGPVGGSIGPASLSHQTKREATFSVHKAKNPAQFDEPFLLIVRTRHIVTIPNIGSV